MENIEQALQYFRKSMEYLNNSGDIENNKELREMQIKIYNNIGSCYLHLYRYPDAEPNFLQALELNRKNPNPGIDASIYNNLGIVNKEKKNFPKAFEYYKKSLGIRQLLDDSALIAQTCNNLGDAFMLTGKF